MNINVYGECYICSLENAPLSPCNCKNMFIHEKCQIKSIRRLKNLNCTVCKGEYTNIKVRTIKRTRFTRISKIIIGFVISGVFLMTLGFIHIFIEAPNYDSRLSCSLTAFGIFFVLFGLTMYIASGYLIYYAKKNNIPFILVKNIIIPRIVKNRIITEIELENVNNNNFDNDFDNDFDNNFDNDNEIQNEII